MDFSAALTDLQALMESAGVDDEATRATTAALAALVDDVEQAVPTFVGLQLFLAQHPHPVTLTAFDPTAQPSDSSSSSIATSLRVPLSLLGLRDPDQASTVSFYASRPGAFVDLAADLSYALGRSNASGGSSSRPASATNRAAITLDDPIQPKAHASGLDGVVELSTIRRAIGMLIGNGHLLEEAEAELARQAAVAGVTILAFATELVRPGPHR